MRVLVALSILPVLGCNPEAPTPTSATAVGALPPPTSAAPFSVSGTVYESTPAGARPLAGVPLDISVEYQSWPPQTTTDSDGRYSVTRSGSDPITVKAEHRGYSQPCAARTHTNTDSVLDVFLVRDSTLQQSGLPASFPIAEPTLSGTIYEQSGEGKRPVPYARVTADYSGGMGWGPAATTIASAEGRYTLCGIQPAWVAIYVSSGQRSADVPLEPGISRLDIELPLAR